MAQTPAPENLEGERKTVTALFADIKGSTELEQDLDPEDARAIVDPALKLMIDAVQRYDGYVVQSIGDGIFAIFGAPMAFEDDPAARPSTRRSVTRPISHRGCRSTLGDPVVDSGEHSTAYVGDLKASNAVNGRKGTPLCSRLEPFTDLPEEK
jgi:class 3 adenylate cyclase